MTRKDDFILIPFLKFSSNYDLLNIAGNRLLNQVDFYSNPKQQEPEDKTLPPTLCLRSYALISECSICGPKR